MRVTLNEIYRIGQKAAEGAGAPAGLDSEVAQATVWLLAHGFPVLGGLATALENLSDQACRFEHTELNPATRDASAKAGPLIAPGLVDLLVARADTALTLSNLNSPLYLLPSALRYATKGWHLRFELSLPSRERFILDANPVGAIIYGSTDSALLLVPECFRLHALCVAAQNSSASDSEGLAVCVDQETLAKTEGLSRTNGVRVDPGLWQRLQTLALQVLVPASAESRRGAGARGSDNE